MFIRVGRHKVPDISRGAPTLERGRFSVAREGTDLTVITLGTLVARAIDAADVLRDEGISVRVLNAAYIAPLDAAAIVAAARETRAIVTAEEANIAGGLGAAVAAVTAQLGAGERVPMRILGVNEFAPTGNTDYLLEHFGLTRDGIVAAARELLRQ